MKKGKWKYINLALIGVLLIIIIVIMYIYHGQGREEIVQANNFINKLKKDNIIQPYNEDIKFKLEERNDGTENNEIYTLTSDIYMIEINKEGKVISFVDKSERNNLINISLEEASKLAEKYIKDIDGLHYKIKYVDKNNTNKDSKFYSIIFSKYEDGYPYYSEEIIMNINKNTGKLQGYVNKTKSDNHDDIKINISKEKAEKIALDSFNKESSNGKIVANTYLAFCNTKDSEKSELAYIVEVSNDKEKKMFFISSDSGKIINSISNIIEKIEVK